jgi:hypothetical protein
LEASKYLRLGKHENIQGGNCCCNCKSAQVLCLARNRLQSLPEALGAFSALQVLDCSGNRLTSVPRVVGRCTALQQLLMSSNRLRGLTSGIGNLFRLQLLDLSHNQYRHLPTMTGDLTQLRVSSASSQSWAPASAGVKKIRMRHGISAKSAIHNWGVVLFRLQCSCCAIHTHGEAQMASATH